MKKKQLATIMMMAAIVLVVVLFFYAMQYRAYSQSCKRLWREFKNITDPGFETYCKIYCEMPK